MNKTDISVKILIVGDVHGEWGKLSKLINRHRPDMVLSCGDFGYWPKWKGSRSYLLRNRDVPIHFCDGNHEDHESLRQVGEDGRAPGMENVFYRRRGTTLVLPDGRTVLFMGGADSIDKKYRTPGYDWFPEETIKQSDIGALPDCRVDIVISHTCPSDLLPYMREVDERKTNDPSNAALSVVLQKYKPCLWYFGHWHTSLMGRTGNTEWRALNMAADTGWWEWLKPGPGKRLSLETEEDFNHNLPKVL